MIRSDETTTSSTVGTTTGDCVNCAGNDLPVTPFVALRVAFGMLLGEEEFRYLLGNPRGKQMIHSSWLHGSGVVWGYDVVPDGVWNLKVSAGLAIDGIGRELMHDAIECLDVRPLVNATATEDGAVCVTRTIEACLVAEFDSCLSNPVPTLADPCDVTRKHDDYSQVVERVKLSLLPGSHPARSRPYHRVRVLLGLDTVGAKDPAGQLAKEAQSLVSAAPADRRPRELLSQFRRLAALDSIDIEPEPETGECFRGVFPVPEADSAVVLACVEIDVRERDGCPEITDLRVDRSVRTALLPTATIQELSCGLAPGLFGAEHLVDAGGPRVVGERIELIDSGRRLIIPVTAPLARGSVRSSVEITSISVDKHGGWVPEDIYNTRFEAGQSAIVVDLADRPINDLIRIVVKGTGPKPVMGIDGVPLAGLVGGPPGTRHDGLDAVWTLENTVGGRDDPAAGDEDNTAGGPYEDDAAPAAEGEEDR